ncbi:uncharacterized protein [Coffea arabica]|uniref:Uncharacterized protein n=1 Tax=Coffea arabica TaxID=13443 RepID=A0A6P6SK73_COFAR|nr:uncharacterized protein LOC113692096 [Coffea arabica]
MSVQEADMLSSQPIPKRQKFEPDKHLFVCFRPVVFPLNPMWYAVKSVSLSHLSGGSSEHDNRLHDVVEWCDTTLPHAMGFCCAGGILYGVGGEIFGEDSIDQNSLVRELRFTHLPLGGKSYLHSGTRSSMKWGKFSPIVVEIGGLIYALSRPPILDYGRRETVFEVYDPSKNEWTGLDGPPFLSPFTFGAFPYSYVVIDKKLCVSNLAGSCAFDTENWTWEACDLFAGFYDSDIMSSEEKYFFMESHEDYKYYLGGDIGHPFPFVEDAIFYEGFLLCNVPDFSRPSVVAFEIVRGKVARRLTLLDSSSILPRASSHFVDLGGGDFCLVSKADECPEELTVVKFKVWKGEDGGLGCADVMESTLKFSAPGRCLTIYAFAL